MVKQNKLSLPVCSIMCTDFPFVFPTTSIKELLHEFICKKISAIPICDEQQHIIGLISDSDIIKYIATEKNQYVYIGGLTFSFMEEIGMEQKVEDVVGFDAMEIAKTKVISINSDNNVKDALLKFFRNDKIKMIPVLDHGKIVGTITRADIIEYIFSEQ